MSEKNKDPVISILLLENRLEDIQRFEILLGEVSGQAFRLKALTSLQEGQDFLKQNKVDVILASLALSDQSGEGIFEVLHKAVPQVPLFILGDAFNDVLALKLVGAGAHDYLIRSTFSGTMLSRVLRYAIERKKAETKIYLAEEKYRTVFENSAVAITVTDHQNRIISWNRYAEALLGMTAEDLYLKPVNLLYPVKEWQRIQNAHVSGRKPRRPLNVETQVICKDSALRDVDLSISVLSDPDGRVTGSIGILKDISERKKLERMKDEFIGTVSHELRTPLTIIRESVSQIVDQLHGPVNEDQGLVMGLTLEGIDRLIRIVNDLLDISKLEAGKVSLHREYMDMVSLVQSVCIAFSAKARSQGVEIKTQFSAPQAACYADRDKITQVLTNLLGNALKFTGKGGIHIWVREQPEEVLVCVEDTGIGLTEQELSGLFQKFQQFGRTAGPGEKGTGLGLAISKGIMDLHHGRLWAESAVGKGSRFYFSLPKHTAREFFRQTVEDSLRQAISREDPLSLVLVTLQDFENIESIVNSQAWPEFLQKLEHRLRQDLARSIEFVHNGRQILLAMLPKTAKQDALMLSGRMHQILSQTFLEQFGGLQVDVLAEVIAYPEDGETLEALIDKLGVF